MKPQRVVMGLAAPPAHGNAAVAARTMQKPFPHIPAGRAAPHSRTPRFGHKAAGSQHRTWQCVQQAASPGGNSVSGDRALPYGAMQRPFPVVAWRSVRAARGPPVRAAPAPSKPTTELTGRTFVSANLDPGLYQRRPVKRYIDGARIIRQVAVWPPTGWAVAGLSFIPTFHASTNGICASPL